MFFSFSWFRFNWRDHKNRIERNVVKFQNWFCSIRAKREQKKKNNSIPVQVKTASKCTQHTYRSAAKHIRNRLSKNEMLETILVLKFFGWRCGSCVVEIKLVFRTLRFCRWSFLAVNKSNCTFHRHTSTNCTHMIHSISKDKSCICCSFLPAPNRSCGKVDLHNICLNEA